MAIILRNLCPSCCVSTLIVRRRWTLIFLFLVIHNIITWHPIYGTITTTNRKIHKCGTFFKRCNDPSPFLLHRYDALSLGLLILRGGSGSPSQPMDHDTHGEDMDNTNTTDTAATVCLELTSLTTTSDDSIIAIQGNHDNSIIPIESQDSPNNVTNDIKYSNMDSFNSTVSNRFTVVAANDMEIDVETTTTTTLTMAIQNQSRSDINDHVHEKQNTDYLLQLQQEQVDQQLIHPSHQQPHPQHQKYKALYHLKLPTGYIQSSSTSQSYCDVYILGTAHVSNQSCSDVQSLMQDIQPDFLFLELCNQRLALLVQEDTNTDRQGKEEKEEGKEVPPLVVQPEGKEITPSTITSNLLTKNPGMSRIATMSSALLTKIQGDYATKLGVVIGGEFRIAFQMAMKQEALFHKQEQKQPWSHHPIHTYNHHPHDSSTPKNGCTVVLGDRPMRLTLTRAWESLNLFSKIRLILGLLWSCIRQPSEDELRKWIESILNDPNSDLLTKSMEELGRTFPTIQQTIVHERDLYMAVKLLQLAKLMGEATAMDGKQRVVLAIVGVGHCKGMVSYLSNYSLQMMEGENMIQSVPLESVLLPLVETKRLRADKNHDIQSLISDIIVVGTSD